MLSHNFILHVGLGARYPENAAQQQFVKMLEINIGLVENHNLTGGDSGADCSRFLGVIAAGNPD